ncbi:MAG: Unknown protein [uncultured Sulfurovum sp.]|uniref:Lipoprotein n=1 Tax=uncultured Sulfurovum sp. TaxID=269237 RepID=A0A6S6UKX4_9BACT|nr:MAG: Unknown protein [uncultured Sulfurovum sp.]
MIKKSTLINFILTLLVTLIFTGCVERGYTIQLQQVPTFKQSTIDNTSMKSDTEINSTDTLPDSLDTNNVYNPDETSFELFEISDEVKNNISGFFVIAIGLVIILL